MAALVASQGAAPDLTPALAGEATRWTEGPASPSTVWLPQCCWRESSQLRKASTDLERAGGGTLHTKESEPTPHPNTQRG